MNDDVYRRQGFGHQAGLGQRPALLIVDFVNGFADAEKFGGGNIPQAIAATRPLLAHARAARWPIAFTRVVYAEDGSDAGVFCRKVPGLVQLTERSPLSQVDKVQTPVLVIHNEADYRTALDQGLQFYAALKMLKKPAKLAVFPESSHGMSREGRPSQRVERLKLIDGWFSERLKN